MNDTKTANGVYIRKLEQYEENTIKTIVDIHMRTFTGFFLTFMGKGFLKQMYGSYVLHPDSGLYVACDENDATIGFLAYSSHMSDLYKFMIKKKLIPFAWYSLGAFLRKPVIFMRLIRAFLKPSESKREERCVYLSSIGVDVTVKSSGVGSKLIQQLIDDVDFAQYAYIYLDTDALNNDSVNKFYVKNGFVLHGSYETHEGRKMNEYRRDYK